jgi:hypothetical protein
MTWSSRSSKSLQIRCGVVVGTLVVRPAGIHGLHMGSMFPALWSVRCVCQCQTRGSAPQCAKRFVRGSSFVSGVSLINNLVKNAHRDAVESPRCGASGTTHRTISGPDSARGPRCYAMAAISVVRLPLRGLLVAGVNSTCYYNDHKLLHDSNE